MDASGGNQLLPNSGAKLCTLDEFVQQKSVGQARRDRHRAAPGVVRSSPPESENDDDADDDEGSEEPQDDGDDDSDDDQVCKVSFFVSELGGWLWCMFSMDGCG